LEGAVICQVDVDEKNLELAKQSLKRFSSKLPGKCYTDVIDNVRKAKL